MRNYFNKARSFFLSHLWTMPLLCGLVGLIAGHILATTQLVPDSFLQKIAWPGDAGAASDMLSFIASTTLAVLTTTISMTLVVLQVASGSFSHQLLSDYIHSKAIRGILSVYSGVFCYALMVLRNLKKDADLPPQLAMTVAMVLIVIAFATFIWYVSRVVNMVQVDSIIHSAVERSLCSIEQLREDSRKHVMRPSIPNASYPIHALKFGYVREIDSDLVAQWADKENLSVVIDARPGDQVLPGQIIGYFWSREATDDEAKTLDLADRALPDFLSSDASRVSGDDFTLGLRQLLDIIVRALSPGINDPSTAIHALGQATTILKHIATNPPSPEVHQTEAGELLVWASVKPAHMILDDFISDVRRYASAEPNVLIVLLNVIAAIETTADNRCHKVLQNERRRIICAAEREINEPDDVSRVVMAARYNYKDAGHVL